MELILEILFEIILDGSLELAGAKKVPMVLRILATAILIAVYGGLLALGVLLTCSGIEKTDWMLAAVGLLLVLLISFFGVKLIKKYQNDRADREEP